MHLGGETAYAIRYHTRLTVNSLCAGPRTHPQVSLLNADWPPALLATEDGCEVWGTPNVQVEG